LTSRGSLFFAVSYFDEPATLARLHHYADAYLSNRTFAHLHPPATDVVAAPFGSRLLYRPYFCIPGSYCRAAEHVVCSRHGDTTVLLPTYFHRRLFLTPRTTCLKTRQNSRPRVLLLAFADDFLVRISRALQRVDVLPACNQPRAVLSVYLISVAYLPASVFLTSA